jgi:hypothetical protein
MTVHEHGDEYRATFAGLSDRELYEKAKDLVGRYTEHFIVDYAEEIARGAAQARDLFFGHMVLVEKAQERGGPVSEQWLCNRDTARQLLEAKLCQIQGAIDLAERRRLSS